MRKKRRRKKKETREERSLKRMKYIKSNHILLSLSFHSTKKKTPMDLALGQSCLADQEDERLSDVML